MSRFFPFLVVLGSAACSEQGGQTFTVDELVADDALLSRVMSECRNNPGELRETATCKNAESADGKLRLDRMRQSLGG